MILVTDRCTVAVLCLAFPQAVTLLREVVTRGMEVLPALPIVLSDIPRAVADTITDITDAVSDLSAHALPGVAGTITDFRAYTFSSIRDAITRLHTHITIPDPAPVLNARIAVTYLNPFFYPCV